MYCSVKCSTSISDERGMGFTMPCSFQGNTKVIEILEASTFLVFMISLSPNVMIASILSDFFFLWKGFPFWFFSNGTLMRVAVYILISFVSLFFLPIFFTLKLCQNWRTYSTSDAIIDIGSTGTRIVYWRVKGEGISVSAVWCSIHWAWPSILSAIRSNTQYFEGIDTPYIKQYAVYSGVGYCFYLVLRSILEGGSMLLILSKTQYYRDRY